MEIKKVQATAKTLLQKYKFAVLIVAIGLVLMLLPNLSGEKKTVNIPQQIEVQEVSIESRLEEILSNIYGAGKVQVLLKESKGEETLYQTDDDTVTNESSVSTRLETVTVTDSDRTQKGLIRQINPPVYLGAVIVCQGGDDPNVCLAIVDAVSDATGLGADRITVLKMK